MKVWMFCHDKETGEPVWKLADAPTPLALFDAVLSWDKFHDRIGFNFYDEGFLGFGHFPYHVGGVCLYHSECPTSLKRGDSLEDLEELVYLAHQALSAGRFMGPGELYLARKGRP